MNVFTSALINVALAYLVTSLKGGAAQTESALMQGQPVKAAAITVPGVGHVVFTAQLQP